MTMTIERTFQMVKVSAGDWLLPSNDGQQLWRLRAYDETGDAVLVDADGNESTLIGRFWDASLCELSPQTIVDDEIEQFDVLDPSLWSLQATCLRSRTEAIEFALRASTKGEQS